MSFIYFLVAFFTLSSGGWVKPKLNPSTTGNKPVVGDDLLGITVRRCVGALKFSSTHVACVS